MTQFESRMVTDETAVRTMQNEFLGLLRMHYDRNTATLGEAPERTFEVLNALALAAGVVIAGVPQERTSDVHEWFDNAVAEAIADVRRLAPEEPYDGR